MPETDKNSSNSAVATTAPEQRLPPNHANNKQTFARPPQEIRDSEQITSGPGQQKQGKGNNNGRRKKTNPQEFEKPPNSKVDTDKTSENIDALQTAASDALKKKRNNRNRQRRKQQQQQQQKLAPGASSEIVPQDSKNGPSRSRRQNQRRKKNNNNDNTAQRYPWRSHIPEESVDPITLESLHTLLYPPFALYAEMPYEPIESFPLPNGENVSVALEQQETQEERQKRILQEQWGDKIIAPSAKSMSETSQNNDVALTGPNLVKDRHIHLYDGRALAYYMVSQLQFIDPLNRRDLTRDEIVNLDRYLKRHGFQDLNVVEAYDAKGVTISTAGAAATTAAGRALMLQQEAAALLKALFYGPQPSRPQQPRNSQNSNNQNQSSTSSLTHGYQAHQQLYRQQQSQQNRGTNQQQEEDTGIYGDADGILVIDDDINPGLRGSNTHLRADATEFVPVTSNQVTLSSSRWGHRNNQVQSGAVEFPALSAVARTEVATEAAIVEEDEEGFQKKKKSLPKSNTLAKITTSVKKTDPEERRRMLQAHEAWKSRAMSDLAFGGVKPVGLVTDPLSQNQAVGQTEGQLERNRLLADALGIKSSSGASLKAGWARPTGALDNEATAIYSDELIIRARERLPLLDKLERRWKLFLEDDSASSLPLWPMDRPTRAFVHEYSDFWRLNTESFDPEPKRYIHCVKLLDTRAPYPLLSDAARYWKGRQQPPAISDFSSSLRNDDVIMTQQPYDSSGIPMSSTTTSSLPPQPQERPPKLQLQKRTLPLELPPYNPPSSKSNLDNDNKERKLGYRERMEEKARKEREQVQAKRQALEAAFASDEDRVTAGEGDSDAESSKWSEQEELYASSSSTESTN